jgi:hypothetical protein
LKERGGSYRELQEKLKEVVIRDEWREMSELKLWAIKQGPTEMIQKFWERLLLYFDQLDTQEAFKKKVFVAGARLPIQELWRKKINGILAWEDVTPIILIKMVERKEIKEKVIEKVRSTQGSSKTKATLKRDGKIQCYECGGFGHIRTNCVSRRVVTQPSNLGIKQPDPRTSSNRSGVINSQGQPRANAPPTQGWGRGSSGRG